ncbi:hypothetical protein [Luteolibacter soli]|uniref:Secreted protein n=1 Tax=Luteolibacter soli TaxID=3135280 RepID=A0ABU9AN94_9BACT
MKLPALLLIVSLSLPCSAEEDKEPEFRPSPLTQSEDFPEKTWKPDDKESWQGPFAEVLRDFLKAGLPDPTGLPYHRITIVTGNCYAGDHGPTEIEAWLLPGEEKSPHFAIAWNGLVYPVLDDRGDADLKATVAKILKAGEKDRASWFESADEATLVTPTSLSLIHGLYLTRLGFPDAAKHVLEEREADRRMSPLKEELAVGWTWSHLDRAISAHMRGDSKMVLASAAGLKRSIAGLKTSLGTADPMFGQSDHWIEQAEQLSQEATRRMKAGKTGSLDEKAFLSSKPGTEALIEALDRIQMSQISQPGDVPLWESPIVLALAEKGDDAVEPLITCLESDTRLTQSVHFWRDFHKSRTVLGVHEAALHALQALLQGGFFQLASTGDSLTGRGDQYRKELAAGIRSNWEKYGKQTGPRRSYQVLLDDAAGIDGWLDAAGALFHPTRYDADTGEPIPPKGPIPGEVLRERKDPSVSDLLEKGLAGVEKAADDGDEESGRARMAFLAILLDWDPARGRAKIAGQTGKWLKNGVWSSEDVHVLTQFLREVADRTPEVLPVFEEMAWTLSPGKYDSWDGQCAFVTQMMLKHGASMKRPATELWTHPDSPWCLKSLRISTLEDVVEHWNRRKLTTTSPFGELLDSLLADDTACGTASLDPGNPRKWTAEVDLEKTTQDVPDDQKFAIKPGTKLSIRRKDVVGRTLKQPRYTSEKPAEPVLEYYWSVEDRDKWLEKLRDELKSAKPGGGDR